MVAQRVVRRAPVAQLVQRLRPQGREAQSVPSVIEVAGPLDVAEIEQRLRAVEVAAALAEEGLEPLELWAVEDQTFVELARLGARLAF